MQNCKSYKNLKGSVNIADEALNRPSTNVLRIYVCVLAKLFMVKCVSSGNAAMDKDCKKKNQRNAHSRSQSSSNKTRISLCV